MLQLHVGLLQAPPAKKQKTAAAPSASDADAEGSKQGPGNKEAIDVAAVRAQANLEFLRGKRGMKALDDLQPQAGINTKTLSCTYNPSSCYV